MTAMVAELENVDDKSIRRIDPDCGRFAASYGLVQKLSVITDLRISRVNPS